MNATTHLGLINVFIGDIQGGLGPFLSAWLADTGGWSPARVGFVTTLVGIGALFVNGPAGALVDRLGRPRLLIGIACATILAGTLLILPARSSVAVFAAQMLAAAGGVLLLPSVMELTLGIVGKDRFPKQQGRNQAYNHLGILIAAGIISFGTDYLGPAVAFWVLSAMAALAIIATATTPGHCYSERRAMGWKEDDPDDKPERAKTRSILSNRKLMVLAVALALFNLGNGGMLTLLSQKLVAAGHDATAWTARYVMVAQLVMIPVALLAGSLADKRGRRKLLLVAFAVLPVRAVLSALIDDPVWLISAEILDGVASGIVGVAVPVIVADLTWGSGRTQTALGTLNTVQGIGGALSAWYGGLAQSMLGWSGAFLALGAPALLALGLVIWLDTTTEPGRRTRRRERQNTAAAPA